MSGKEDRSVFVPCTDKKETRTSSYEETIFDDWRGLTMLCAIALQMVQMTTNLFQNLFAKIFNLGSLAMGAYYVNTCKYMQTFKVSAQKLEANNAALHEKVGRLEKAAKGLISTIARFDTDTAHYLSKLLEHDVGLQDSIDHLNHAVHTFSRVFQDETLSHLWKETLETVKAFQQAKAEYDQIRIAIQFEREILAKLHIALRQDESLLADLYKEYSQKLVEILSLTSSLQPTK